MIDFGKKYKEMEVEMKTEVEEEVSYPRLYVRGVKGDDGMEVGEITKVMAKVKKCSMTEREEDGETVYDCEYEVHGFGPCPKEKPNGMKMRGADFLNELDKEEY